MEDREKVLIFLCTGGVKSGEQKLSYRIALQLEDMNVGTIGNPEMLSHQLTLPAGLKRNMIFLNDCQSDCVNALTNGVPENQHLFIDVSPYMNSPSFNIGEFIASEILPRMDEKWDAPSSTRVIST